MVIDDSSYSYKTRQHNFQAPGEKCNIHKAWSAGYEQSSITFFRKHEVTLMLSNQVFVPECVYVCRVHVSVCVCLCVGWIVSKEVSWEML